MIGLLGGDPLSILKDAPKIPPKIDLLGSLASGVGSAFKEATKEITSTLDIFIGQNTIPNLVHRKTFVDRLFEFSTPSITKIIPFPAGALRIATEALNPTTATFRDMVSIKVRFPLMSFSDSAIMAYMGQRVAYPIEPDHDSVAGVFRAGAGVFDPLSSNALWGSLHYLTDIWRNAYTLGKIGRALSPFFTAEKIMASRKELGVPPSAMPTLFELAKQFEARYFWGKYKTLKELVLSQVEIDEKVFPMRYNSNIMYNRLPYKRFRYEAVCKIEDFYLFLDELSDYKESYNYPFQLINTLYSNHYYKSGGRTQIITMKASLVYLNRKSCDYFIRLGNSERPLRFISSHDSQRRYILILSIDAEHKFQPSPLIFENPKPAVSKFTIRAAVMGGDSLPPFNMADYGDDPSLMVDKNMTIEQRYEFTKKLPKVLP